MATMLQQGQQLPDVEFVTEGGERLSAGDLEGEKTVLYFYPKDDTPGCTKEACAFRDRMADYERADIRVYGVSLDSPESHRRFREKYGLPFTLLSDPDHEVSEDYGVWVEKTYSGKTSMGINRSTFVIDADGTVARALYGVKPDGHAELVLDALPA